MNTTVSEKKSVKTLKGQLFGALSMMLVASIALGTSTYAWFVSNSTVEVSNMKLTVDSSAYLQIAVKQKGAATYTEYKNLLSQEDIVRPVADTVPGGGWTDMFTNVLTPASVTDENVATGTFYQTLGGMVGGELSTYGAITDLGEGSVKKIPLSFKSSTATDVYLGGLLADGSAGITSLASLVSATAEDTSSGVDAAAVAKALRIAIVPHDGTDGAVGTPVIFQFSEDATVGGYNTYYDKVTPGTAPFDTIANIKAYNSDANGTYAAVADVFGATPADTAYMIQTVGKQTAEKTNTAYLATVTPGTAGAAPEVVVTGKTKLFSLAADVAVDVDVYIWLEGIDKQCTVELGSKSFNLRLPFAAASAPTTP